MSTKTICEVCGKEYEYDENNIKIREEGKKRSYDSSKFCCYKCAMKFILDKQKKTLSEKYGKDISNPFHLPGVQEKARATSLERYGTEFGVCSEQSVKKRRATCKKKYGVEFALQNKEIKQKTYDSNVENHGGVYHLHTKEVMQKQAEGHRTPEYREKARQMFDVEYRRQRVKEIYGVDNVFRLDSIKEKIRNTLKEKYGVENMAFVPEVLRRRRNSRMLNEAVNTDDLCKDFLEEKFVQEGFFKLNDMAKYFNISLFAADSFKNQLGVTYPNEEVEDKTLEFEFYQFIRSLTDCEIIRNSRKIISPLELDIYIPDMKLAFEFNGNYWHSINRGSPIRYHSYKTKDCEKKGIRLIHIWEDEWVNNRNKIEIFIKSLFTRRPKIRASKCEIKEVSNVEFVNFCEKYHLLGSTSAAVRLGLYYNNELVSAIGLVFEQKSSKWNLKRYVVGEYQVMGGFEKLFKYFIEQYKPKKIITFVENSKFLGTVNFRNGFVLDKELPPDFFWVINDKRADKWTVWKEFKQPEQTTAEYQAFMMTFALKCYDAGKKRLVWVSK